MRAKKINTIRITKASVLLRDLKQMKKKNREGIFFYRQVRNYLFI